MLNFFEDVGAKQLSHRKPAFIYFYGGTSRTRRRVPSRSAPVRLSVQTLQSVRRLEQCTRLLPHLLVCRMPCPVKFDHRRI
jgi:hypothetical protein